MFGVSGPLNLFIQFKEFGDKNICDKKPIRISKQDRYSNREDL